MILDETKVIADLNREILEIYDLKNDPKELKNIEYNESYKDKTLRLLLWGECQRDYYQNKRWKTSPNERCYETNNFKI